MEPNYFYNFGHMTHSAFPEIAFGILCLVATVVLIFRIHKNLRKNSLPKPAEPIPFYDIDKLKEDEAKNEDLRIKIQGYWRDRDGKRQFYVYPWGRTFLMMVTSLEGKESTKLYAFSTSIDEPCKFYAEANDSLTFLYNADLDNLFIAEEGVILERLSEWRLKLEDTIRKAITDIVE